MGGNDMKYLRPRKKSLRKGEMAFPLIYIIDGDYCLRSSADLWNACEPIAFDVHGNCYGERVDGKLGPYSQPNWYNILKRLCDKYGRECVGPILSA